MDHFPSAVHKMPSDDMFSVAFFRARLGTEYYCALFLRGIYELLDAYDEKRAALSFVKIRNLFERQAAEFISVIIIF